MNYNVTVNDLVQAYWEKEASNLTIICTVQEEHPLWFLILMSFGIAVPRDCKGQGIFFLFSESHVWQTAFDSTFIPAVGS